MNINQDSEGIKRSYGGSFLLLQMWNRPLLTNEGDDICYHCWQARKADEVIGTDPKLAMPAAFVSFKTRRAAAVCAQTQQTRNTTKWITDWAPEPRDVYWKNLAIPYFKLTMRNILMQGALVLLLLFYLPPVLFVQSLANLDSIQKKFKFLRPLLQK